MIAEFPVLSTLFVLLSIEHVYTNEANIFEWMQTKTKAPSQRPPYKDTINRPLISRKAAYQRLINPSQLAGTEGLDCKRLFDPGYLSESRERLWTSDNFLDDAELLQLSCAAHKHRFHFPAEPLSDEEASFPLAYTMIVSVDAGQVLNLLQAIYQPQNVYCLHIDSKSKRDFESAIQRLVSCFPNVFLAQQREEVYWAHASILNAAMHCFRELARQAAKWRCVQILAGTDVPLKTNAEMVQIFKWLNGSNDCELQYSRFKERYTSRWELEYSHHSPSNSLNRRYVRVKGDHWYMADHKDEVSTVPPAGLTPYKGSFAATLSSDFLRFLVASEVAQRYLEWLQDKYIADEFYWPTLIHNLHLSAPGSFPGCCLEFYTQRRQSKPWISRHQIWEKDGGCAGQYTHLSCVYGIGDLPILKTSPALFAHKFYATFEPASRFCLLELHYNRTYYGRDTDDHFEAQYYQELPSVRYQNMRSRSEEFVC